MAEYITYPIDTDPLVLAQLAYDDLESSVPGWLAATGSFESILIGALAQIAADVRDVASDVPSSIFRYFGANVMNIPPEEGLQAEAVSTWVAVDSSGYTIPAGTLVGIPGAEGLIPFETDGDINIPNGSDTVTDVTIRAVDAGAGPNGMTGDATLIDSLSYISSVTATSAPAGGADPETDDEYLNRLSAELQLMSPRPILPADFAQIALRNQNVSRCVAIDGYNPGDSTYNNDRMVTVVPLGLTGAALTAPQKSALDAELQALREVNFIVNVDDPTFSDIDVTAEVTYLPGYEDTTALAAAVEAALTEALDPLVWGADLSQKGAGWLVDSKVRYLTISDLIYSVPGVRYVKTLAIGKDGGAQGTSDLTLTGPAPLPNPGTLVITAVAHS